MLELGEEPLDQVALAVEPLAKAGFPLPIGFGRDVRRGSLLLYQFTDAVGVIGLVGENNCAGAEMVEQRVSNLSIVRLSCR